MVYIEKACAKLNLFLEVTGKRADGYHDLSTVMVPVGLYDVLHVDVEAADRTDVSVTCGLDIPEEDNLVYRACMQYLERTGLAACVRIGLDKRIPTGAGLGGGSADAAAVLRVLDRHFGRPLSREDLFRLGASLGADVPFCLQGETCLCRGIGEILTPVENRFDGYYLIAKGDASIGTADAYRRLDEQAETIRLRSEAPVLDWLKQPSPEGPELFNRFEAFASESHPEIAEMQEEMRECGALATLMTGSGAAVFGMFASKEPAEACRVRLSGRGYRWDPAVVRTARFTP